MKKSLCTALMIFLLGTLIGNSKICEAETNTMPQGGYMPYARVVDELPPPDKTDRGASLNLMTAAEAESDSEMISGTEYYGWNIVKNKSLRLTNAYLHLAQGLIDRAEVIDFSEYKLSDAEFEKVFYACVNDWPQLYYLGTGYRYIAPSPYMSYVAPDYIDYLDLSDYDLFEAAADNIIKESGVRPYMSDYDKAIMLHDELINRIEYDHDAVEAYRNAEEIEDDTERENAIARLDSECEHIHSAFGALVYGKAVCDGYSKAYQYLLYKVGILSHMATGPNHAWNLVRLDEKWYYTDLTWDDTDTWHIYYDFFNMTDAQLIESGHSINNPYVMPKCTATENNYFTKNGGIMSYNGDIDNVVEQLKKNSYARVYVTGDIDDTVKITNWYKKNIKIIANKLGMSAGYTYDCIAYNSRREFHLILYRNTLYPMRNISIEIGSTTTMKGEIIIAFYDENDVLVKIYQESIDCDEANILRLKYFDAPNHFKKIKYYVWDNNNRLKPLYASATEVY